MIESARDKPLADPQSADICIIGSGPAGLTVARQLRASGLSVIILESGGDGLWPDSAATRLNRGDFEFRDESSDTTLHADAHYLTSARVRHFGGTTFHWTNWCRPLDRVEFVARPWLGSDGWPITYDELSPYYEGAYEACGVPPVAASAHIEDACDIAEQRTFRTDEYRIGNPKTKFAETNRDWCASSANTRVILHATVTSLQTTADGQSIQSVHVSVTGAAAQKGFRVVAKRFVLAAGAIENARLLMHTPSISSRLTNAGRYFAEHPHFLVGQACLPMALHARLAPYNTFVQRHRALVYTLQPDVQAQEKLLNIQLDIDPLHSYPPSPRYMTQLMELSGNGACPSSSDPTTAHVTLRYVLEQHLNANSRVSAGTETDEYGHRRPKVISYLGSAELRSMHYATDRLSSDLGRNSDGRVRNQLTGLQRWTPDLFKQAFYLYGHHQVGTTRMSDSPSAGVVDRNCKLHGVNNMYVAGASVFSTPGHAPPTLTLVALALRLANHLLATDTHLAESAIR